MSYLKVLAFYSKSMGTSAGSDVLWFSRNVDFIYSCVMAFRKTKTLQIQKLNVYLESSGEPWDGTIEDGIVETKEKFLPATIDSGSAAFELALSEAANSALFKIAAAGQLDRLEVEEIIEQVISTSFVYSYVVKKFRRKSDGKKFTLTIESRFGQVFLNLTDQKSTNAYSLFKFWPSPWIVMMKLKSAEFLEDGRLAICLLWQEGNEHLRFGIQAFEAIPDLEMQEVKLVEDKNIRKFLFEVP